MLRKMTGGKVISELPSNQKATTMAASTRATAVKAVRVGGEEVLPLFFARDDTAVMTDVLRGEIGPFLRIASTMTASPQSLEVAAVAAVITAAIDKVKDCIVEGVGAI